MVQIVRGTEAWSVVCGPMEGIESERVCCYFNVIFDSPVLLARLLRSSLFSSACVLAA